MLDGSYATGYHLSKDWFLTYFCLCTIVLERNADSKLNTVKFKSDILSTYQNNTSIKDPELICQIPLNSEIFKFFYVNNSHGGSTNESIIETNNKLPNLSKIQYQVKKHYKYKLVKAKIFLYI